MAMMMMMMVHFHAIQEQVESTAKEHRVWRAVHQTEQE
jgi:hypothetical protein